MNTLTNETNKKFVGKLRLKVLISKVFLLAKNSPLFKANQTLSFFTEQQASESLSSLIDFLCSKQNSLKACKREMPDAMKRMASTFKNPGPKQKLESYLIPFLNVLSD